METMTKLDIENAMSSFRQGFRDGVASRASRGDISLNPIVRTYYAKGYDSGHNAYAQASRSLAEEIGYDLVKSILRED